MPKRKAVRGKRGGGAAGRKSAQAPAVKEDEEELTVNANSSQESEIGLDNENVGEDSIAAAEEDPDMADNDSVIAYIDSVLEQAADDSLNLDQAQVTNSDLEPDASYSSLMKENTCMEEFNSNDLDTNNENQGECIKTVAQENCENVTMQETGSYQETTENESNVEETVYASKEIHDEQGEEFPSAEQQEELLEAVNNADDSKGKDVEFDFMDKEFESEHNEMEEVQYIDEEAGEDQQLLDVIESLSNPTAITVDNMEIQQENDTEKQSDNSELIKECEVATEVSSTSLLSCVIDSQKAEDINSNKFEEISEGSIDHDQEDLSTFSDLDIIVGDSIPKKIDNEKNANLKGGKMNARYNETESLEEVFFATENDDVKITAEDKDNDDISDASLFDTNMSLEEISDDDLEPSKRKKKPTEGTPIKTEKIDENIKADPENAKVEEKSESVKANQANVTVIKRAADDVAGSETNSSKRLKSTNEAKSNEEISDSCNLLTDIKKEGVKSQDTDASHNRNALNRRSSIQISKNDQQDHRERPFLLRDAEHRRKLELVNSGCQTEPRTLKGKIVQCNINPVKSNVELGLFELQPGSGNTVTKLVNKFRNQLPSSIPEKIFTEVTSLQLPQKVNTFSFSMGPVTLSDMDCLKFRDALRCTDEFSLAFDQQCRGILKSSVASHERITSLIRLLKLMELGNRYMVMSVVYKFRSGLSVGLYKATIMFMYEQDIQMESQSLVSDGKIRAKLCLKGVPIDVSKDFIQLLFPEAIKISSMSGAFDERIIVLGFSNAKMVEEILSCYDMLVICGSQVDISEINSAGPQNLTTGVHDELEDILLGDTKSIAVVSEKPEICVSLDLEKELTSHKDNPLISDNLQNTNLHDQIKEGSWNSDPKTDGIASNQVPEIESNDMLTAGRDILISSIDSHKQSTTTGAEIAVSEATSTTDPSEQAETNTSQIDDLNTIKLTDGGLPFAEKDNNKKETDVIVLDDNEDNSSVNLQKTEMNNLSKGLLSDTFNTLSNTIEFANEPNIDLKDSKAFVSQKELLQNTKNSTEILLENDKKDNTDVSRVGQNIEKKVNVLKKEASKETNDENLEDVSDEEIINHSKHEEQDDVVILKEDSTKWVVACIDLTHEESDTSGKVVDKAEDKKQQLSSDITESSRKKRVSNNKEGGNSVDPKLVMTDGSMEVSLEVIDVNEGSQEMDKVIYAHTWRQSRDRSRERNKWDSGYWKGNMPHAHPPWRENQWSMPRKPDVYYSQYPYKYGPPNENVPRMQRHHSGFSPEESSNYRMPAREETSFRRNPYFAKHKRDPSPKQDPNYYGPPANYGSDHRPSGPDYWEKNYNWRPGAYGDSKKTDSYSRAIGDSSGKPMHAQARGTAYHSWRDRHHDTTKSSYPNSRNSRGAHYKDHKHDYKKSKSQSYSDLSISSGDLLSPPPPRRSSYRRDSPHRQAKHRDSPHRSAKRKNSPRRSDIHASRSPISVSSRSHSLSPVSKSPSPEISKNESGKEELVKTVKHFLELAKGLQQSQKRRSNRSRSPISLSPRHSKSPLPARLSSPHISSSQTRKTGRSSRYADVRSPHRSRSRSPLPLRSKHSRSPSYKRASKYKHERSMSSSSSSDRSYKKHSGRSYSNKKEKSYRKKSRSPEHRYDSKRSERTGDSSKTYEEQSSKSKSGQSDSKYRSTGDQSWQQSSGGYQTQSGGSSSTSNLYNPAYPPPGMYSGSSSQSQPYNSTSQYSYSTSIPPPPYVQSVPPPQVGHSYQSSSSYSSYQPSQTYISSGHHNTSSQNSSAVGVSSSSLSKSKKSWSMGSSAMVFQRVLETSKGDKKSKSGFIDKTSDRDRKHKQERVLTSVQMEKK